MTLVARWLELATEGVFRKSAFCARKKEPAAPLILLKTSLSWILKTLKEGAGCSTYSLHWNEDDVSNDNENETHKNKYKEGASCPTYSP